MKNIINLLLLILFIGCSSSRLPEANQEYAVSSDLLFKSLENSSVVQNHDARLNIKSVNEATYHVRKVTTVMKPDGRDAGKLILFYGGFQDIGNVEGALYDSNGDLIRRMNESDGKDYSLSDGYSLYEDSRVKIFEMYLSRYPYTVVYDYEIKMDGLLNLPQFSPQSRNQYIQKASLDVSIPHEMELNYHILNLDVETNKQQTEEGFVYRWEMENMDPVNIRPLDKSFEQKAPQILLAVNKFEMANSKGSLKDWNSFGSWYYSLGEGRDKLPEHVRREVQAIFSKSGDRREGIKKLYEYLQNKTRYVSIQLGIGGWQPYDASYVEKNGYGDCKALTNYMHAILKAVGVKSYPVLIGNGIGRPDIITDFPSNQFNHVILMVPDTESESGTIWLESTSQNMPFNYIGYSNSDRHGLAVTPDTSYLVKTPKYDGSTNFLKNKASIKIDPNGDATINLQSKYSGYYLDQLIGNIGGEPDKKREKWFQKHLSLDSITLRKTDFSEIDQRKREPSIELTIYNPGYASSTGSRIFIPLNKLNKLDFDISALNEERQSNWILPYEFTETDVTVITIPEGTKIEAMPSSVNMKSDIYAYNISVKQLGKRKIEIQRHLEIKERILPAEKQDQLQKLFATIISTESKNIVLNKK